MKPTFVTLAIPTRDGKFLVRYSPKGLAVLGFPPGGGKAGAAGAIAKSPPVSVRRWHALATKALQAALAGRVPRKLPPLDLSSGTAFQRAVWGALRKIALGKTHSYSEIAASIGRRKAVRAVGGACGANPIAILVPCHRVLAANGKLGGFGAGLKWKRALLVREGVKLRG